MSLLKKIGPVVIATFAGWLALSLFFPLAYDYDSAVYISMARSLRQGHGLMHQVYGIASTGQDMVLTTLYPPGFSFLIYIFSFLGLDEFHVAIALQGIAFAAFPLMFFLLFRRILPEILALILAIMCTWTYPLILWSYVSRSDLPFLLFTLVSLELFFCGVAQKRMRFIFMAGLVCGFSCIIRNAGYAMICAGVGGLVAAGAFQIFRFKTFLKAQAAFLSGVMGVYSLWLIRNWVAFQKLQPYKMEASELSLIENIKYYCWVLTETFLGSDKHANLFIPVIILFLGAWAILTLYWMVKDRDFQPPRWKKGVVWATLAVYAAAGTAIVIIARTKYRWGEFINERHIMQYQWILTAAIAATLHMLYIRAKGKGKGGVIFISAILIFIFSMAQAGTIGRHIHYRKDQGLLNKAAAALVSKIQSIPEGAMIASNRAHILTTMSGRPVLYFDKDMEPSALREKVFPKRDLYVIILRPKPEKYRFWLPFVYEGIAPEGYAILEKDENYTLMRAI